MTLLAIIKFKQPLEPSQLKKIQFPNWVIEKWCSACKVEFISDIDYENKKVFYR